MADNEHQAQADDSTTETTAGTGESQVQTPEQGTSDREKYERQLAEAMKGWDAEESAAATTSTDDEAAPESTEQEEESGEQVVETETTEETEEQEETAEEEAEETPLKTQERFRFKDDADKAVAALAKAKGISLVEAAKIFESATPAKAEAEAEETPARTAKDIEAEIKKVRTDKRQAMRDVDTEAWAELDERDEALQAELAEAKAAESTSARTKAEREQAENDRIHAETYAMAEEHYPALKDPNSPLFKRVKEMADAEMEADTPLSRDPRWSWTLVKAAAGELKIPIKSKAATPAPKAQAKTSPTTTRPAPASGSAGTKTPVTPDWEKDLERAVAEGDMAAYDRALKAATGMSRMGS